MSQDREQILEYKAQLEREKSGQAPLMPEQINAAIVERARQVRCFYEALVSCGFSQDEALKLTAHLAS